MKYTGSSQRIPQMRRAVIYARCSTEEESQKDALAKQVEEAKKCVSGQGWMLVDCFVESKSGTTIKGRDEYQRLYEELFRDTFDIIVIKSQDRLMRNVKDWYLFLDRMITGKKRLFMYLEGQFYSTDDSLITGIKAILAEEYSRELSKKINNAHRNRQLAGQVLMLPPAAYGYEKTADKKVVIREEEAKIVRQMYLLCTEGNGSRSIANILYHQGYRNRQGGQLSESSIRQIIRNPIHKGTAVMNKVHYDFQSKRTVKIPPEQWIIHEHAVPAIVSEELWQAANTAMNQRAVTVGGHVKRGSNKGKYDLSGKIICGMCQKPYYKTFRRRYKDASQIVEWKCSSYLKFGRKTKEEGCDNIHLEEKKLVKILQDLCENGNKESFAGIIEDTLQVLKRALGKSDDSQRLVKLEKEERRLQNQMDVLLDKLLDGIISDSDYRKKGKNLKNSIKAVQEKLYIIKGKVNKKIHLEERIRQIRGILEQGDLIRKATLGRMIEDIDHIVVYPEHLEIKINALKINTIQVPLGENFCQADKIEKEKKEILGLMADNPSITAKIIGQKLNLPQRVAVYRINSLKKEGKLYYSGKGGHGKWQIKTPDCNST